MLHPLISHIPFCRNANPFSYGKSTFYGSSGANFPNQCQKDGHEIQVWPLRLLHVTSNKCRSGMDTGPKPVHLHLPWNLTAGAGWTRGLGCFAPGPLAVSFRSPPLPLSLEPGDPLLSFTLEGCPHLPSITFASCNVWRHWSHRKPPCGLKRCLGPAQSRCVPRMNE